MLKHCKWSEDRDYKTGSNNEPLQFYLDGLTNSSEFHLLLGYFSSAAINLLSIGFAKFISGGGKMRMVINHLLSDKDKAALETAESLDCKSSVFDLTNFSQLEKVLNDYDKHFFECLAFLIASKRIEIKIIKPKKGAGIAHYKSGVFSDGENYVGYKASCNFTLYGLTENLEELEAFLSWENGRSQKLIEKQLRIIDNYFNEKDQNVEYLSAAEVEEVIRSRFGNKDINELIVQEETLLKKKASLANNKILEDAIKNLNLALDAESKKPRFPYKEGPRIYQQTAFANWKNNDQQGLFAMATGTGKTITSLNCLLEIYKKTGYYKSLILVPTITLVNQWEEECKKFNFSTIVKVFSKNKNWKNDLAGILIKEKLSPTNKVSFIIISTYASFSKTKIFAELNQTPTKTLLIADECHNMGSPSLLKLLPKLTCKRRIGLSATPERQFDEEANTRLASFFNSESGYTYEYSMREAIGAGVLCRYYYYPHLVSLTESEMTNYLKLSLKIAKYFNPAKGGFDKNDTILTALLLARKRIIHKAFNKVSVFCKILNEQFQKKGNLKYTLVYVPEGNDPNDYFETDVYSENDEMEIDPDAVHLIDIFTRVVKDLDKKITVRKFISGTREKDNMLEQFANGGIDVLTSMKCLDEGVDVPRAELAIFCASTGNPRQFIQRRGRILRQHPNKQFAYIHDLVVIPEVNKKSANYEMERSMLKKELERVNNFASLSENSSHTVNVLFDTMSFFNLNLYNNE